MNHLAYQKKALAQLKKIEVQQEKLMALTEDYYPTLKSASPEGAAILVHISIRYQRELDLTAREIKAITDEITPIQEVENV